MKSNVKRILSLLLVMAMMLTLFTACGKKEEAGVKTADEEFTIDGTDDGTTDGDATATESGVETGTSSGGQTGTSSGGSGGISGSSGNGSQGSSGNTNLDNVKSSKQVLKQVPSSLRGTTLKVVSWNEKGEVPGADKVIANFTKATGIKVEWKRITYDDNQYFNQVATTANAGDGYDIMRYQTPDITKMQIAQDLKTATGFDFENDDVWDSFTRDQFTIGGKLYGINLKNTFNMQPRVIHYSQTTIDAYGYDDPYELWKDGKWTYDKFIQMCKDFKADAGTGKYGWMTSNFYDYMYMEGLNTITYNSKTNKYVCNIGKQNLKIALEKVASNMTAGIISPQTRSHDNLENGNHLFFSDNIIGSRKTDSHYSKLKTTRAQDGQTALRCVPMPTIKGKTYYQYMQETEAYGIPKGAKNPKAVYYFLRYFLDANNYDEKTFFTNAQALEVYKWCRDQKNKFAASYSNTNSKQLEHYFDAGTRENQVSSVLQTIKPIAENEVKDWNNIIAKMKK